MWARGHAGQGPDGDAERIARVPADAPRRGRSPALAPAYHRAMALSVHDRAVRPLTTATLRPVAVDAVPLDLDALLGAS